MDGALLVIASNEKFPQPQTLEHLAALEIMKLEEIIIIQNKIDLVKYPIAKQQYEEIIHFSKGTIAEGSCVIPISAQHKYNIDVICEQLVKRISIPKRDFISPAQLTVIRSFDINRPGAKIDNIKGGVAGGSITQGVLKVGLEIEIRPGILKKDSNGKMHYSVMLSQVTSLFAEQNSITFAVPGGLLGIGTLLDPTLTRADRLVGQVLGQVGNLPAVFIELEISFFLLKRLLGVKTQESQRKIRIEKLTNKETLMLNIGSMCTGARLIGVRTDKAQLELTTPVCTKEGEKVALSRHVEKHWRLIGWGIIQSGKELL